VTIHPSDDDLVLHYYGELDAREAPEVERHLQACPGCAGAWRDLTAVMALVDQADAPEPDAAFESRLWARRAASRVQPAARWSWRQAVVVGGWAAVVALLVSASQVYRATPAPAPIADAAGIDASLTAAAAMRERVLLTAVNDHLSQAEMLLVELLNAPPSPPDLGFERVTASDLLASGRLYRQTARQTGDEEVAGMLDEIEGVLVEVARSPDHVDSREFQSLRAWIHRDDLLFKVRAATTDVRGRRRALLQQP
jgi:anti-sigma-K factor RskA